MTAHSDSQHNTRAMLLGAMGVVFGDIGTSPLYTIKDCLSESHYPMDTILIMGILSLIFWSITVVVTLKYVGVVLRADNNGEGGVLSLLSLNLRTASPRMKSLLFGAGAIGAALFYGDAVITPAISVLSAIEGLTVVSSDFTEYVIPATIVVLILLFVLQEQGTERIGGMFGPAMLLWFCLLGGLGISQIIKAPGILKSLNPSYAYHFFMDHGFYSLGILGSVVLAITGAEALYTDLGHFGKSIIRRAWLYAVFPALILNYFGQGALLINNPETASNPFFFMVPSWATLPLVIVATLATIIASQAVISGIFSMTWQAVQLGYLPRMLVNHTSRETIGQVFVPTMNWSLLLCAIILVVSFKSSTNLASAYGMAVTGIMVITTFLTAYLAWNTWQWSWWKMILVFGLFGIVDLSFFGVNLLKFSDGGWIPFCVGVILWAVMTTWVQGKKIINDQIHESGKTLNNFVEKIKENPPLRIPGTAVYMSSSPDNEPTSLSINFKHNKVLHEKVVLLSVLTMDVPRVHKSARTSVADFGMNIFQVIVHVGYMEKPNINAIFDHCDELGLCLDMHDTSFFMSRGIPISSTTPHMLPWRERLFIWLAKNAMNATEFYKVPHKRVVELGVRLKM